MSQDNLTGTNILGCAAQYKTSTSYSLWVLVAENLTKYLPRDTDVPAEVPSDSGETNAHTQYWPWRLHAMWSTSRNPSSLLAEILPLNSTAPAWLSSASPKPLFVWVTCPSRILPALCPGAAGTQSSCWQEHRVDGGSKLQTLSHLKARIPSGRGPCHCTLARHTPTHCRETLYSRNLSPCAPTLPWVSIKTLVQGFSQKKKQHPLYMGVTVFPAFWRDLARGWMQWGASPAAGPLLAFILLFPASVSFYQIHKFCLSSWQADFF